MEEKKSLWQTLLGTIQGLNNEGSSKRATIFWLVVVITTSLTGAYVYGYIIAVNAVVPTPVHVRIIHDYNTVRWTDYILILTLAGYATLELITAVFRKFTGGSTNDKNGSETKESTTT